MPHCDISTKVDGKIDFPIPLLPREYFPLPWTKRGFQLGFHVKGRGPLVVQLVHNSFSDRHNDVFAQLIIDGAHAILKQTKGEEPIVYTHQSESLGNNREMKKIRDLIEGWENIAAAAFWLTLDCIKPDTFECTLKFGRQRLPHEFAGIDGDTSVLELSLGNVFANYSIELPTHFAFVPGSKETDLSVAAICLASYDGACAHSFECQKSDPDFICSRHFGSISASQCQCPRGKIFVKHQCISM